MAFCKGAGKPRNGNGVWRSSGLQQGQVALLSFGRERMGWQESKIVDPESRNRNRNEIEPAVSCRSLGADPELHDGILDAVRHEAGPGATEGREN